MSNVAEKSPSRSQPQPAGNVRVHGHFIDGRE